jgi:hypothetical protein
VHSRVLDLCCLRADRRLPRERAARKARAGAEEPGIRTVRPSRREEGIISRKNFSKNTIVLLALCFLESGCSSGSGKATWSKPTRWSMTQIESKIQGWAKLKEIHLTEKENGKYEGTGTGEDGLTYKINATYTYSETGDKAEYEFHFDAEGPKGIIKSGTEKSDGRNGSTETIEGPKPK